MRALIRFGKQPRLRFISHLDLQRFFQRAVNRTGLPIAYTQGFNPHPIMSFGSALALGWTSEYEVIDIKLSAPMGRKRTEDAVRAALPEDLPVLEVRMVEDKHPAPMACGTPPSTNTKSPEETGMQWSMSRSPFWASNAPRHICRVTPGLKPR